MKCWTWTYLRKWKNPVSVQCTRTDCGIYLQSRCQNARKRRSSEDGNFSSVKERERETWLAGVGPSELRYLDPIRRVFMNNQSKPVVNFHHRHSTGAHSSQTKRLPLWSNWLSDACLKFNKGLKVHHLLNRQLWMWNDEERLWPLCDITISLCTHLEWTNPLNLCLYENLIRKNNSH